MVLQSDPVLMSLTSESSSTLDPRRALVWFPLQYSPELSFTCERGRWRHNKIKPISLLSSHLLVCVCNPD